MPGHKGRALPDYPALAGAYAWDITEFEGADSLYEANGILREGERLTAGLYGSADCCWSAGGSTLCIQAMLAKMKAEGRVVIAARTVHRAFLNACVLLGLEVEWVFPREGGLIAGAYHPADFDAALRRVTGRGVPACVYVTSPDYCGNLQDIAGLSLLCRRFGAKLLVDNAHGAHLAFLSENRHPIALGADLCCDSLHKTLPALTGAAMLHASTPCGRELKRHMEMFGSTSPSYLILQSIESAVHWLKNGGIAKMRDCEKRSAVLRAALPQYTFPGSDPLHLTIRADGIDLSRQLRAQGVECEYADRTCLVLLPAPIWEEEDWKRLTAALLACRPKPPAVLPALPPAPERVMPLREAALAAWERVPTEKATGRICGPVQVPCPPAVPLLISGERITKEWAALLAFYGIPEVAVVRSDARS